MQSVQRPWEGEEGQKEGLNRSAEVIVKVVREEAEVVGLERVIVGGMSQGCAMGIFALLTKDMKVGGFFGMCGWLPLADEIEKMMRDKGRTKAVLDMPVLLQHCRDDSVVPVENGLDLKERLEKMGMSVRWECFDEGGHWLNEPEGMDGIVRFVREIMEKKADAGS